MNRSLLMSVLIFCYLQFPTKAGEDDFTSLFGADSVRLHKSFYGAMDLLRRKAAKTSGSAAYNVFSNHIVGKLMPKAEVYNIAVLNDDFMSILFCSFQSSARNRVLKFSGSVGRNRNDETKVFNA